MNKRYRNHNAFTIVELLVVIIVIAILAGVATVTFIGFSNRAKETKLTTELSGIRKKLELFRADNTSYPSSFAGGGVIPSQGTILQYTYDNAQNPPTFCVTESFGGVDWYIRESGQAVKGACPGHTSGVSSGTQSSLAGTATTLAGSGTSGSTNATGTSASFYFPRGVAVDSSNNTYVADTFNHRIRKINPSGVVTTLAGSGSMGNTNGTGTAASFSFPHGVAVDSSGNIFVTDNTNNVIRKITPAGVVTTFAGSGSIGYADGPASSASFSAPSGIAIDSSDNLYVCDTDNALIRKITSAGIVSTLAGNRTNSYVDGNGTSAAFYGPSGIAVDANGVVYVADLYNSRIRKIASNGSVTTVAGSGAQTSTDGIGTSASFNYPLGVAVDKNGVLYVSEEHKIRTISTTGVVTTLAGSTQGYTNGTASNAKFSYPSYLATDNSGVLYIADRVNHVIRKVQ